jgi:hypothetical protein
VTEGIKRAKLKMTCGAEAVVAVALIANRSISALGPTCSRCRCKATLSICSDDNDRINDCQKAQREGITII